MSTPLQVTAVRFTAASPAEVSTGLLGWVQLTLACLVVLDGVAVRRTLDGRLALSFPSRRDSSGRQHAFVRPANDVARVDLERQVFASLGFPADATGGACR